MNLVVIGCGPVKFIKVSLIYSYIMNGEHICGFHCSHKSLRFIIFN